MSPEKLFFIPTKSVPKGGFEIYQVPDGTQVDDNIKIRQSECIFQDAGSLAEDLVGIGVIQELLSQGKSVGVVCNPEDLDELAGQ